MTRHPRPVLLVLDDRERLIRAAPGSPRLRERCDVQVPELTLLLMLACLRRVGETAPSMAAGQAADYLSGVLDPDELLDPDVVPGPDALGGLRGAVSA